MTQQIAPESRIDRASENAPSLLVAYLIYLSLAAISVSAGGRIPAGLVWLAIATTLRATSKRIAPMWSLYNGLAAALFFASFASKPFGDVHVHHTLGWLAVIGLLLISFGASLFSHRDNPIRVGEPPI